MSDNEATNGAQSPRAAQENDSHHAEDTPMATQDAEHNGDAENNIDGDHAQNEASDLAADAANNGSPDAQDDDDDIPMNEGRGGDDSELSEVDEAEFADFDPTTINVDDRPAQDIDEDAVRQLKARKRKGTDGPKKPKEGKREKKSKKRERRDQDDDFDDDGADGEILEGKRRVKGKSSREPRSREDRGDKEERLREKRVLAAKERQIEEDNMTEEQKRAAALDRAMDAALRNPNKRRKKKDEIDLEAEADEEINALKLRMESACAEDNEARQNGQPAINKLKLLPEVLNLMNRQSVRHSLLDPDTNFLQSVKFFLEPLNDGSLPAYNIQRDIFQALERLPIDKETLLSSGIGKVVVFYTKSKKPEIGIKRIAERLLADWSRPILKRTDDYKKRKIATADYDAMQAQNQLRQGKSIADDSTPAARQRDRALEKPIFSNRARIETHNASYTVAPRSTFDAAAAESARPMGAAGLDAFRRMTAKKVSRRN